MGIWSSWHCVNDAPARVAMANLAENENSAIILNCGLLLRVSIIARFEDSERCFQSAAVSIATEKPDPGQGGGHVRLLWVPRGAESHWPATSVSPVEQHGLLPKTGQLRHVLESGSVLSTQATG